MNELIESYDTYKLLNETSKAFKLKLPKDVLDIHKLFKKNKFKLFVVGGAVRDALQNKKPKDFDLATDAKPEQVKKVINTKYKTIVVGKSEDLGVVVAVVNGEPYEIATFRTDVGKGRRPDSVEFTTIETDVKRRDLTINGLFYDIDAGEIVDLVGGVEDMKNKVIRAIGDAKERFDDDPLRKMRAIRFAGRTNGKLDSGIIKALKADNSINVSGERIRDEFKKSIEKAIDVTYVLNLYNDFGILDLIFKDLTVNKDFNDIKYWPLQLGLLLHMNSADDIKKKLNKINYTTEEVSLVMFLIDYKSLSDDTAYKLALKWVNVSNLKFDKKPIDKTILSKFAAIVGINKNLDKAFQKFTLSVKGGEVMKQYNIKGKDVGLKVKELETANFKKLK